MVTRFLRWGSLGNRHREPHLERREGSKTRQRRTKLSTVTSEPQLVHEELWRCDFSSLFFLTEAEGQASVPQCLPIAGCKLFRKGHNLR